MMRIWIRWGEIMSLNWMICRGSWGIGIIRIGNLGRRIHIWNLKLISWIRESKYFRVNIRNLRRVMQILLIICPRRSLDRKDLCLLLNNYRNRNVRWRRRYMFCLILRHKNQEILTLSISSLKIQKPLNVVCTIN